MEFGRFLVVGLSNTLVSYLGFEAALWLLPGMNRRVAAAQFASYALGTLWAYILHGRYTFRQRRTLPAGFMRFVAIQFCMALITAEILARMAHAGLPMRLSWVLVTGLAAVCNYQAVKRLVFGHLDPAPQGGQPKVHVAPESDACARRP